MQIFRKCCALAKNILLNHRSSFATFHQSCVAETALSLSNSHVVLFIVPRRYLCCSFFSFLRSISDEVTCFCRFVLFISYQMLRENCDPLLGPFLGFSILNFSTWIRLLKGDYQVTIFFKWF